MLGAEAGEISGLGRGFIEESALFLPKEEFGPAIAPSTRS